MLQKTFCITHKLLKSTQNPEFKMKNLFSFLLLFINVIIYANQYNDNEIKAVEALGRRVLKAEIRKFEFHHIDSEHEKDIFEIETIGGKIVISGNSGISMAAGLNYYLNNYCGSSVSWLGNNINIPFRLPVVKPKISVSTSYIYRPYFNYCTFGYSAPFWDWKRWEKELDWMALNGINMPLLILGQEAVWQNVLKQMNFSEREIAGFIPGPTHAPWWLMQNLEGEGGLVSQHYIDTQTKLMQKVLKRARELGMKPVMQGFFGMVPCSAIGKFPNEKIYDTGKWAGGYQRPAQLNPSGKLFELFAETWYSEQIRLYGEADFYAGDPFHEGSAPAGIDLYETGRNIQLFMQKNNPEATWVLQCWQNKPYDAMLAGTDPEKVLILELSGEGYKFWQNRNNTKFKWVYCIINNYGGKQGIFGRLNKVNADLNNFIRTAAEKNLKGLGVTPEGIDNNPVAFQMLYDYVWIKSEMTPQEYVKKFTLSRYGMYNQKTDAAWNILLRTALNCPRNQEGTTESVFCARPSLDVKNVSTWSGAYELYYPASDLVLVLGYFLESAGELSKIETYRYDLVDITRQCLANKGREVYVEIVSAYQQKNITEFEKQTRTFLKLIDDQNRLMGTLEEFLLGKWIKDARAKGKTKAEKNLMEYNAKLLLTLWKKESDTPLHEYAHREWNGLLGSLYKTRWEMFFAYLTKTMNNEPAESVDFFAVEKKWIENQDMNFIQKPSGNSVDICKEIYQKYFN